MLGVSCEIEDSFGHTAHCDATIRERGDVVKVLRKFANSSDYHNSAIQHPLKVSEEGTGVKICDICEAIILIGQDFYHCSKCTFGDFDMSDLYHQAGTQ